MKQLILLAAMAAPAAFSQTTTSTVVLTVSTPGGTKTLRAAITPGATDGIDTQTGEQELPPFPPSGVFEARFIGDDIGVPSLGNGVYNDYRGCGASKTYELKFQRAASGEAVSVSWTMPSGITGTLQDLFGGIIVNAQTNGTGTVQVANPAIDRLKLTVMFGVVCTGAPSLEQALGLELRTGPSPARGLVRVHFRVGRPLDVRVTVVDVLGREVRLLASGTHHPGSHDASFDAATLPAGTYYVRLETAGGAVVRPVAVVR